MGLIRDWFQEKDNSKRFEIENQLVSKLSPEAQEHWTKLAQTARPFDKQRQMGIWIRDAMDMKVDQDELETFFASEDKLSPERRQQLLDEPRAKMEADLKALYFNSKFGIASPGQVFGEFGESGRMWSGSGMAPREGGPPNRPPGFGPPREPRPDGAPPGERRQRKRPAGPPGDPPQGDQKQEAI
jgi:hypothetical protein